MRSNLFDKGSNGFVICRRECRGQRVWSSRLADRSKSQQTPCRREAWSDRFIGLNRRAAGDAQSPIASVEENVIGGTWNSVMETTASKQCGTLSVMA